MITIESMPMFFKSNGTPLNEGYIYIGTKNLNPETNPITVYWDEELTQPAAQPIRTSLGKIYRGGAAAMLYANEDYSITVKEKSGSLVYYLPSVSHINYVIAAELASKTNVALGSTLVGWLRNTAFAVGHTLSQWLGWQEPHIFEYMSDAQITDVQSGASLLDHTTAINRFISDNQGKRLKMPPGTFNYIGGADLNNGTILQGSGKNLTIIRCTIGNPTYLFNAAGNSSGIEDLKITQNVAQVSGSWVKLSGSNTFINEFQIDGDFNGIHMTGNVLSVTNGEFSNGMVGSIRIRAEGDNQTIEGVLFNDQSPRNVALYGILVSASGSTYISGCTTTGQSIAINIESTSSAVSSSDIRINGCVFTSNVRDINVFTSGTGSIYSVSVVGCALRSSTDNSILVTGSAAIYYISVDSCNFNGGTGTGVGCENARGLSIDNCTFDGKQNGVFVNNTSDDVVITGNKFINNSVNGLVLASGTTNAVVVGNVFVGNATQMNDSMSATSKSIHGNVGIKTKNSGNSSVPNGATSVVVNHGLYSAPRVEDILISTTGGSPSLTNIPYIDVTSVTSTTFTVRTAAAAAGNLYFNWRATLYDN